VAITWSRGSGGGGDDRNEEILKCTGGQISGIYTGTFYLIKEFGLITEGITGMFSQAQEKDWQNSPVHLLLLSKFRNSSSLDRYRKADYWEEVLKEKPLKVIERFIKEGMLEPAGLQELVSYKFNASELKSLLKEKGLKVSGRKDDLVQRLIENDEQLMRDSTKDLIFYCCTNDGIKLVDHYLEGERKKKESVDSAILDLLAKKEFSEAVRVVAQYEASQVFPRGLGIDWKNYDVKSDTESLKVIFEKTPGILNGIEKDQLATLRQAAAMMELWGKSTAKHWLPDDFQTGIHLDGEVASRMLVSHARHNRAMKGYKLGSVKTVAVINLDSETTCPECRKIGEKKYKLANVPELPYAKCTCKFGCRCTTIAGDFFD